MMREMNPDVPAVIVGGVGRVKSCRRCLIEKPIGEFGKWPFRRDTYFPNCRYCERIIHAALKAKHAGRSRDAKDR